MNAPLCQIEARSVQLLARPSGKCAWAPWQVLPEDDYTAAERLLYRSPQEIAHLDWTTLLHQLNQLGRDVATWPRRQGRTQWPTPSGASPKIARFFWLALRDGQCCRYCMTPLCACNFTIDHLTPTRRGGTNAPDNLGLACLTCNAKKGSRTEAEFLGVSA